MTEYYKNRLFDNVEEATQSAIQGQRQGFTVVTVMRAVAKYQLFFFRGPISIYPRTTVPLPDVVSIL